MEGGVVCGWTFISPAQKKNEFPIIRNEPYHPAAIACLMRFPSTTRFSRRSRRSAASAISAAGAICLISQGRYSIQSCCPEDESLRGIAPALSLKPSAWENMRRTQEVLIAAEAGGEYFP